MNNNHEDYDTKTILEKMRQEYWRGVTEEVEEEASDQLTLLGFRLGGEKYAIRADNAKEIIKVPGVVRVPRTPPTILGIINLRGRITPITDPRPVLGLKADKVTDAGRVIIVEVDDLYTGMLVEEVEGINSVPREEVTSVSIAVAKKDFLEGQVLVDERPMVLIDLSKLLNAPDFKAAPIRK